ncbi:MAG: hypothetical protein IEMM0002_0065 [bacterium]|nr:MAG: hypothetical protein IEMM0002_0065 [bacterium]
MKKVLSAVIAPAFIASVFALSACAGSAATSDRPEQSTSLMSAPGDANGSWASGVAGSWGIGYDKNSDRVWVSNPVAFGGDDLDYQFQRNGAGAGAAINTSAWIGSWAADMAFNMNTGMLWQVNVGGGDCIHELDPLTLTATGNTICPAWAVSQHGLAYDYTTDTYYAGGWNEQIVYHFDSAGTILDSTSVGLPISGLAYNPSTGHLFVMVNDSAVDDLYVLDVNSGYSQTASYSVAGLGDLEQAGLAIDCVGSLWAVNQTTNDVIEIDSGETSACPSPWRLKADMPTPRTYLTASVANGKIYAIGGGGAMDLVEEYDPAIDTWTDCGGSCATMPTPRYYLMSGEAGGMIYVIGGYNGGASDVVEEYDPAADTWTNCGSGCAPMPTPRWSTAISVVNGLIYIFGGYDFVTFHTTLEIYDPATDTWTTGAPMSAARAEISAAAINGKIYVFGGWNGGEIVEEYDPATDTWTNCGGTCTIMPTPSTGYRAAAFGGLAYVMGGFNSTDGYLNSVAVFDPVANSWIAGPPMLSERFLFGTAVVNGTIYAAGSDYSSGDVASVEAWSPPYVTAGPISGDTTEGGGTATFTVQLNGAPSADVSIGVSSSNPLEGTPDIFTLLFTPGDWNIPQTVTVTGVDDAVVDGDQPYTIILSPAVSTDPGYDGFDPADVSVLNLDDDVVVGDKAVAVRSIPDVNGNGSPDVAALYYDSTSGNGYVYINDGASGAAISSVSFGSAYEPLDLEIMPDESGNAVSELAVLGLRSSDGLFRVSIKDASTGGLLNVAYFNTEFNPIDFAILPDMDANPGAEVAVLGVSAIDGKVRVMVKDALTGSSIKKIFFNQIYTPLGIEPVPDIDGNGAWEVAVLRVNTADGNVRVSVKDALTGSPIENVFFGNGYSPADFKVVPDINGNSASEIAFLGLRTSDGSVRVTVKDAFDGATIKKVFFDSAFSPFSLGIVPDVSGNSASELAVLGVNSGTGGIRATVKDSLDGSAVSNVLFGSTYLPSDMAVSPDIDGSGYAELMVLGVRTSDGQARVSIKDASTGGNVKNIFIP